MADLPYIASSACRHGVTTDDIELVLDDPSHVLTMADAATLAKGDSERPNVVVYAGYDIANRPLVVFVDRFENIAFHAEPGSRRFRWLF